SGSRIMSASSDGSIRLWDAQPRPFPTCLDHDAPVVTAVNFTPDGRRVVSSDGKTVRFWDVESGTEIRERRILAPSGVGACALSQDGRTFAYAANLTEVQFVDVDSGSIGPVLRGHTGYIADIRFSPDGSHAATTSGDLTCRVWDAKSGVLSHTITGASQQASG